MNLQKLILTKNDAYTEAKKITPCGIFWHSSGANNPNLKRYVGPDDGKLGYNENKNHWNKPGFRKCGHAMIGKLKDGTIATYQTLPWNYRCMLSGSPDPKKDKVKKDPRGNANDLGYIQFEILEDGLNNKDYAMAVYQEAVEFSAMILKQFGLNPLGQNTWVLPVTLDHASAHKLGLASNHGDVLHWFGRYGITLDTIRKDIAKEMGNIAPTPTPTPTEQKVRLKVGTPYYSEPSNKSKVAGKITIETNYTIVKFSGVYGFLKSGAGWVQLKDEPAPAPGLVDTWAKANTLKQGSKGKHVEVLQALLQSRGYDVQAIDGTFGAVTGKQVRAYQKAQGLTVDGIVGYETWPVILK